jgi:hypothetical protein
LARSARFQKVRGRTFWVAAHSHFRHPLTRGDSKRQWKQLVGWLNRIRSVCSGWNIPGPAIIHSAEIHPISQNRFVIWPSPPQISEVIAESENRSVLPHKRVGRPDELAPEMRDAQRQIGGLRSRLTPRDRLRAVTVILSNEKTLDVAIAHALALAVEGELVQVALDGESL